MSSDFTIRATFVRLAKWKHSYKNKSSLFKGSVSSSFFSPRNIVVAVVAVGISRIGQTYRRNYVSFPDSDIEDGEELYKSLVGGKSSQTISVFHKDRFRSPWKTKKSISEVFKLLFLYMMNIRGQKKADHALIQTIPDVNEINNAKDAQVTWIGHSTCHIHIDNVYYLTDPIWSDRASPSKYFGPIRKYKPSMPVESLRIDYVLLSHGHYDHFDAATAERIGNRATWLVPLGMKKMLSAVNVTNVIELDWWQSYSIAQNEKVISEVVFLPGRHWTGRTAFDRNKSLWGGFAVLSKQAKLYFAGDTAYDDIFKRIGAVYGPFDFSLLPIGAFKPRWFLKDVHCDPAEAIQIHKDIKSKQSMAVHWGTFPMTIEGNCEGALELARLRNELGMKTEDFFTVAFGETIKVGGKPKFDLATVYPEYLSTYMQQIHSES